MIFGFKKEDKITAELNNKIKQFGHSAYPYLSKYYSPSSRIPCIDFTPFIVEYLKVNDYRSISKILRGIIDANPGLGIDSSWGDELIKQVASKNYQAYVQFPSQNAQLELKALFMIAGLSGGSSEFLITEDKPLLFSYAFFCHLPEWKDVMENLIKKTNTFIRKMRKDTPYWDSHPLYSSGCWKILGIPDSDMLNMFRSLPISARIHFMHFINSFDGSGSLSHSTNYSMRSLGVNSDETFVNLLNTNMFTPTNEISALLNIWTKNELMEICKVSEVNVKKSWNKEKLLTAIVEKDPDFTNKVSAKEKVVTINPTYKELLGYYRDYAVSLEVCFKLLCFA